MAHHVLMAILKAGFGSGHGMVVCCGVYHIMIGSPSESGGDGDYGMVHSRGGHDSKLNNIGAPLTRCPLLDRFIIRAGDGLGRL